MTIEDEFTLDAPLERVWPLLADIPRVARCLPNVEITEQVDARTFRARATVKAGPIAVSYRVTLVVEALDEVTHEARFALQGDEVKGRGGVRATMQTRAQARDGKTHVALRTEAQVSGIVATLGGRMIESVAKKTTAEFAANLAAAVA